MNFLRMMSGQSRPLPPLGKNLHRHRTRALLKARQLELVHLVLPAGHELPTHSAPGEITLYCIEGAMNLSTPDGHACLHAGDVVHLAAEMPHAVVALTDASALLTICLARTGPSPSQPDSSAPTRPAQTCHH